MWGIHFLSSLQVDGYTFCRRLLVSGSIAGGICLSFASKELFDGVIPDRFGCAHRFTVLGMRLISLLQCFLFVFSGDCKALSFFCSRPSATQGGITSCHEMQL